MIYWQPALADGTEGYNNLNGALSMNVDVEPTATATDMATRLRTASLAIPRGTSRVPRRRR
jgi:hypothetical protein